MKNVYWADALVKLEEYIFKIHTPTGTGTGFLISLTDKICGIATALHVVGHEYEWEEPIKIEHYKTGEKLLIKEPNRAIWVYPEKDIAVILFSPGELKLPTEMLDMAPSDKYVRQGAQMGWCGFPYIEKSKLCFFSGHVSAYIEKTGSYLVDGVAINGVSGGPAFIVLGTEEPVICGVVSAYIANRATGETLPGVCLIRAVESCQKAIGALKSLEQAKEKTEQKE
jgi:hypothetical protein